MSLASQPGKFGFEAPLPFHAIFTVTPFFFTTGNFVALPIERPSRKGIPLISAADAENGVNSDVSLTDSPASSFWKFSSSITAQEIISPS